MPSRAGDADARARRHRRLLRRLHGARPPQPQRRAAASCASSSAPTAPARRRCSTCSPARRGPSSGKATYDGHVDITKQAEHKLVRLGIGRKFQTPAIYRSLTCLEHLEVALGFRRAAAGAVRRASARRSATASTRRSRRSAWLQRANVTAGALSHGEQQWLEIAMLLVQDPKLLLLDEPVAGMTRQEREKTGELLHTLGGQAHDHRHRARHGLRAPVLAHRSRCCTWARCSRKAASTRSRTTRRVVEVYLGRAHGRDETVDDRRADDHHRLRSSCQPRRRRADRDRCSRVDDVRVSYGESVVVDGASAGGRGRARSSASWAATAPARRR